MSIETDDIYKPTLVQLSNTRTSITLSWNAPIGWDIKPIYKVQVKDKLWGWITKYWGYNTTVDIKELGPEECYQFRLGVSRSVSDSENATVWSRITKANTKDEHISAMSLHRAILYQNIGLATKFVNLRPSAIDCFDSNGKTALMKCARLGNIDLISLLISVGASINLQSISSGSTALMIASWFGHLQSVTLLHDNGAKWDIKDSHGCTALHYAVDNSQTDVTDFAIDCGANIEAKDNNSWTPLHRGVLLGSDISVLSCLIRRGASVNACDMRGQTPLMQAVVSSYSDSNQDVIELLLSNGADVTAKNKYDNDVFTMANTNFSKLSTALMRIL